MLEPHVIIDCTKHLLDLLARIGNVLFSSIQLNLLLFRNQVIEDPGLSITQHSRSSIDTSSFLILAKRGNHLSI